MGYQHLAVAVRPGADPDCGDIQFLRDQAGQGGGYFPTFVEFAVTIGIISLAIFLYRFAVFTWPSLTHAEAD